MKNNKKLLQQLHFRLHDVIMKELITSNNRYDKLTKEELFGLFDSVIGELKLDMGYIIGERK